jgi:hypothetical protein
MAEGSSACPLFSNEAAGRWRANHDRLHAPPWRAHPHYLELAPLGRARRVRATARFRWHRRRPESCAAIADGRGILLPSTLGSVARSSNFESYRRVFGARNGISQRWRDAVYNNINSTIHQRVRAGGRPSFCSSTARTLPAQADTNGAAIARAPEVNGTEACSYMGSLNKGHAPHWKPHRDEILSNSC